MNILSLYLPERTGIDGLTICYDTLVMGRSHATDAIHIYGGIGAAYAKSN